MTNRKTFEVIIVGGSYAGLSAAMSLGRSFRQVLVIDSGNPCNRQSLLSHNFITQDGAKPSDIFTKAKEEVLKYESVSFLNAKAVKAENSKNRFEIHIET